MSALLYPQAVTVEGHPSQHGVADLHLTLRGNRPNDDLHVVLTCDQLLALYRAIADKISHLPIRLVGQDVS